MASSSETTSGHSLAAHQELAEWVAAQGGYIDDSVCIAQDAQRGVHMQVKADWPHNVTKETRVINTPLGVTMSYFNAIDYECARGKFSSHGVIFPRAFVDAVGIEETSAFFLMGQFLRGEKGFWFPYLRTLPQPGQLTTPLFFGEEDVDWLQGTGIQEAAVHRFQSWDEKFDSSIAKLEELGFEGLEEYTWDLYLWASTIITSRAFSAKVLSSAVEASDLPDDGVSVLLPLIDLPNHRPLARVEWRAGAEDVGMIVLEEIAPSQEISNNYGPRNNEQLLMNYGFCLPNNQTDYRIVKLGVKPDSPLNKAKARQIEMFPELAKNIEDHYYIFNVFYPLLAPDGPMEHSIFSPALFNALTVLEANERERKNIEITEAGISIRSAYGNGRSTLKALAQISFELISHITMLQESAQDLPAQPANLKQIFAKIYRNGQITLDKTALVIATWTLARAREHTRGQAWEDTKSLLSEHLDKIPVGYFGEETMSKMQVRILERRSLVPMNGELFRLGELFSLLPSDIQGPSQTCYERIRGQHPALSSEPQIMFALVICLLVATGRSSQVRPQLSSRLTRWVDFLCQEYPLESEDDSASQSQGWAILGQLDQLFGREQAMSWTAEDGATWLAESNEWLNPQWLQWAYTVSDQEMLLIPLEPLQVLGNDGQGIAKNAVMYVPQE
ncbi:uncharacterized protein N7459_001478 [Penicillium hispanicum]|uniref:uncharacterized protein n=1 Tax=Penicillium hispanicum TaxID=1080232 RepID=UPI00254011F7|nr:uncharacterized protein N7459_001478 [Penicillium hispanicum]KAJ5595270.1 hypothetical protein N7459_001478 [Penicillium hispanicum]